MRFYHLPAIEIYNMIDSPKVMTFNGSESRGIHIIAHQYNSSLSLFSFLTLYLQYSIICQCQSSLTNRIFFSFHDNKFSYWSEYLSLLFSSCEDVDSVTASVIIGGQARDIGVYCGSKRPPMLMSNDNRMEVVFTSRGSSRARGFKAIYKFVTGKLSNIRHIIYILNLV